VPAPPLTPRPPIHRRSPLPVIGVLAVLAVLAIVAALTVLWRGSAGSPATDDPVPTTAVARAVPPPCEERVVAGRTTILCRPAGDGEGLVVVLHARGSSAREMQAVSGLEAVAVPSRLAVVYAAGLDGGWGDDPFTAPDRPAGDEDVVFLDRLIAQVSADAHLPAAPVALVGFSNGAGMALRYAAERPGRVRAVVSVAGQLARHPAVRPSHPVPLLQISGTADPIRSYDGGMPGPPERRPGMPTPTLSTPATVAAFVAPLASPRHEGPLDADPDPTDGTRLRTERWTGADGTTVVVRTIVGGGHTWPSARAPLAAGERYGVVSRDVDASAEAVPFILAASAPGAT
jgi:polyhydroxybutyrate depolymerase